MNITLHKRTHTKGNFLKGVIRVSEIELEYEKFLEEEVFWEKKVKELTIPSPIAYSS